MATPKTRVEPKEKYERTADDRAAVDFLTQGTTKSLFAVKVSKEGASVKLAPNHPDEHVGYALLARALGTNDIDFLARQ